MPFVVEKLFLLGENQAGLFGLERILSTFQTLNFQLSFRKFPFYIEPLTLFSRLILLRSKRILLFHPLYADEIGPMNYAKSASYALMSLALFLFSM